MPASVRSYLTFFEIEFVRNKLNDDESKFDINGDLIIKS